MPVRSPYHYAVRKDGTIEDFSYLLSVKRRCSRMWGPTLVDPGSPRKEAEAEEAARGGRQGRALWRGAGMTGRGGGGEAAAAAGEAHEVVMCQRGDDDNVKSVDPLIRPP